MFDAERIFWLMCLVFVMGLGTIFFKSVASSKQVTFCYIEAERDTRLPIYSLKGNVEWQPDRDIGFFPTLIEAQNAMSLCPVGK